jgi:hypothetical protein
MLLGTDGGGDGGSITVLAVLVHMLEQPVEGHRRKTMTVLDKVGHHAQADKAGVGEDVAAVVERLGCTPW